jgi:hypothetical protein
MLPEPWNSMALVLIGSALGAWAFGAWCGCLCRLRWRRQWRALSERQGRDFSEMPSGHTARFIAQQVAQRNAERAEQLKEAGR